MVHWTLVGHWQESDVVETCKLALENAVQCWIIFFSDGPLQLLWHQIAIRVLYRFVRLGTEQTVGIVGAETHIEKPTVSLARLDAFTATIIVCLRAVVSDTVGGQRQKLYRKTFS